MKRERQAIFDKYGGRCAYCGCELEKGWHVDEIEPIRRNWEWVDGKQIFTDCMHPERLHIGNQNPSCAPCNRLKSSQSLEGFRQSIAQFIPSLNKYHNQYKFAKRYGLITETSQPVVFYFETIPPIEITEY